MFLVNMLLFWSKPIKNKSTDEVLNAFKLVLKKSKRHPKFLQLDKGSEFINKKFQEELKARNNHWFTNYSSRKASVAERFNGTIK
jgi:hypothetical protein